jgi:5-hydroxyisourate hydrolase
MGISTHILDTAIGRPAAGVSVSLARLQQGQWVAVPGADSRTDSDGRCRPLLPAGTPLEAGFYLIRFDTGAYYESLQLAGLYPYVEIAFEVRDSEQHYHIPLLLTANGYTTYRGS